MTEPSVDTSTAQQVARDYRWNFIVNSLDGASYWFGMSFISNAIILPLYVSHFTDSPLLIGLIPFLTTAGFLLPQLFVANVVERAPRKKFFPVNLGLFLGRLPILLLAPSAYFLAASQPTLALIGFFVLYTWFTMGSGITVVGWQDMIAKIIPAEKRGRFFGITNFVGNGAGILGAFGVPFILNQFIFPLGYVIAFAIGAALNFMSWVFLSLAREPAIPNSKPRVSQLDYLRSLPDVLRKDRNFRLFLLSQIVFSLSGMAAGFLAVYAVQNWKMPDAEASGFTVTMQIGLALVNLLVGLLADRKGHKPNLEICFALNALSFVMALVAPSPWWFFPIFFLRGAVLAGTFVSGLAIVYEFTDAENRATYIGLANTIPGVAGSIAPLIGGWLAGAISYQMMFIVAAVIGVLSWVLLHFIVRDPRQTKPQTVTVDQNLSLT
jgi:MFS family permease